MFRVGVFFCIFSWSLLALAAPATVALDVGHSKQHGGAISARGWSEFDFNRDLAVRLAQALGDQRLNVREINFDGVITRLVERPAQAVGSDFFISIHHDSISEEFLQYWLWNGEIQSHTELKRGFGIFVSAKNPQLETSLRCASQIGAQLRRAGFQPTPWHGRKHAPADAENGVWYFDNLVVLYRTTLPAVLFEAGVIKHREEELELLDPQRQTRMADAVATGIANCLKAEFESRV
jgi:N-acetylmuramoyl-L-alanine amidase